MLPLATGSISTGICFPLGWIRIQFTGPLQDRQVGMGCTLHGMKARCSVCKTYLPAEDMYWHGVGSLCSEACAKKRQPKKRKALPVQSDKRKAEAPERQAVREAVFQRDDYRCRAARLVPQIRCGGPLDAHEVVPRSAWAAGYLVETNIVTICRFHHQYITDNPAKSHECGLHKFSYERPTSGD